MVEKIKVLVEGGKAVAGIQLGSKLGPLGINIANVLAEINKKTAEFKGMKVPVEIEVNKDKTYTIKVGSPPTSELVKKELNLEKGSPTPNTNKVGNLAIEQVIKIAKLKQASMFVNTPKEAIKSIIGSCSSLGVLVEGKTPQKINPEIDKGIYDTEILAEKTSISQEKLQKMQSQLTKVQEELKKEQAKLEAEEAIEKEAVKVAAEEKPAEKVKPEEVAEEKAEAKPAGKEKEGAKKETGKEKKEEKKK